MDTWSCIRWSNKKVTVTKSSQFGVGDDKTGISALCVENSSFAHRRVQVNGHNWDIGLVFNQNKFINEEVYQGKLTYNLWVTHNESKTKKPTFANKLTCWAIRIMVELCKERRMDLQQVWRYVDYVYVVEW